MSRKRTVMTYAEARALAGEQLEKLDLAERPSALYGFKLSRLNKAEWFATHGEGTSELIGRGETPLSAVEDLDLLWYTGPVGDYEREE